jgi:hypothetical protein
MAEKDDPDYQTWLPVIGKSLAYLCLAKATEGDTAKYRDVLAKVDFLEALGVPSKEAAVAAGSSAASVAELRRQRRNKGHGKKSKARGKP